ncbi:MAG: ABC transporter substrate-binding protein [Janthinobacterium lividum]
MRRRSLLAATAATLAAPLAAPAPVRAASATTLKIVPASDLAALDPVWTTAPVVRNHGYMVFDTLYGTDAELRVQPQMAAGHVVENDGRQWTITLREGLRFHDGEPVLARDAVASIRRFGARDSFGETLMAATDELSAPDDRTLRFRLKRPFPLLPNALGKPSTMPCIMPERLARTDPGRQVTEMVGSGPYRFLPDERIAGSSVAYRRFEGYRPRDQGVASFTAGPKRARFDRVEWQVIPDASTKANALINGEVDWVETPSTDLLGLLRASRKVVVTRSALAGDLAVMVLNCLQPPFDNPAIRRALLGAFSQTDFMRAAIGDDRSLWSDEVAVFNPGTPMDRRAGLEVMTGPRDLPAARRAIEAAGYRGERAVLLGAIDLPPENAYANLAADVLKRIGMEVDLLSIDWGSTVQRRSSRQPTGAGGWSAFFTNLTWTNNFDPASHLGLRSGAAAWFGWPTMPRMEALRAQWFETADTAAQQAICAEIERQFWIDVPYVPLGAVALPTAYSTSLTTPRSGILQGYDVARRT